MIVDDVVLTCIHQGCGLSFAVPKWWEHTRREDHAAFYCPNGHGQSFHADSEKEKIRRERDNLKQQMARVEQERDAAQREANEQYALAKKAEAKAKRLTKRAAAGTCPCCKRTFKELAHHMQHQHPEFVRNTGAKVVPMRKRA